MPVLPDFIRIAGVDYEVVVIRRVVFQGVEYDCRACVTLRRIYVTASAPLAYQRLALARTVRQVRLLASPHWAAA